MPLPLALDIALGHLRRRRRQTLVSILGVALGVGFFVAVNALMRGFQQYFVAQIIDVAPHVVMKDEFRRPGVQPVHRRLLSGPRSPSPASSRGPSRAGIRNARAKIEAIEALPGVAVAPTLTGQAILRYGTRDVTATILGIEPERERRVTNIEKDLIHGRLADLRSSANALILGVGIADRLGAAVGNSVSVISPVGVTQLMKIVGLVQTGITSIDTSQGYALLKTAQVLQDRVNIVNQIRMRVDDVTRAESDRPSVRGQIPLQDRELGGDERQRAQALCHPERDHVLGRRRHPPGRRVRNLQHHLDRRVREDHGTSRS